MLPSLLAALALSAPVPKPATINLSWKFTKGDVVYVTHEEECGGHMVLLGKAAKDNEGPVQGKSKDVYQLTVTTAEAKQTVLSVKYLSSEFSKKATDGDWQKDTGPDWAGKEMTVTLDAHRQITGVKVLNQKEDEAESLKDDVTRKLHQLLRAVPGKTLAKGDSWEAEFTDHVGAIGYDDQCSESTTVGSTAHGLTTLTTAINHTIVVKLGDAELGRLKDEKGQRTAEFEAGSGRIRSLDETASLEGIIDYGGGDKGHLTMLFTHKITVTDEKPKAKK